MTWVKTTRITLVVALLLAVAVLAWLAAHPRLYAGQVSQLITRNLLEGTGARFSCTDLDGNPFERMVFRRVSVTRNGEDGSFLYVTADSLVVRYPLGRVLKRELVLNEVVIGGLDIEFRKAPPRPDPVPDTRPGLEDLELPSLSIGSVLLANASLSINASDLTPLQRIVNARVELSVAPADRGLLVEVHSAVGAWPNRELNFHSMSADALFVPPRLEFTDVQVEMDSTEARLDLALGFEGRSLDTLDLTGEADRYLLAETLRLIGEGDDDAPNLQFVGEAVLTMRQRRMRMQARGEGSIEGAEIRAQEFDGVLFEQELRIDRMVGQYRSARGTVSGLLLMDQDPVLLTLEGEVSGADLSDPWTGVDLDWPASDVAATARMRLELGDSPAIDLELDDLRGELATLPVDSGTVRLSWSERAGLDLRRGEVHSLTAALSANGVVHPVTEELDLYVRARVADIAPWAARVALPIAGHDLAAEGRLIGPIDSMALDATGTLGEARAGALFARDNRLEIHMPRADDGRWLRLDVESPSFGVSGRVLGELEASLDRAAPINELTRLRLSVADSALRARGRVIERPDSISFDVVLDSLRLQLGTDVWELSESTRALVSADSFSTPGIELVSETGRLSVLGHASRTGKLDLQMQVLDGDLSVLDRAGIVEGIDGDVTGALRIGGRVSSPEIAALLGATDLSLGARRLDSASVVGQIDGARLDISSAEARVGASEASMTGQIELATAAWIDRLRRSPGALSELWRGARLDVEAQATGVDVQKWIDPASTEPLFGLLDASFTARGSVTAPVVSGRVALRQLPAEPFLLPRIEGRVVADERGLSLSEGEIDLGGPIATASAQLPLFVSFAGPSRYEPERGMRLTIDTKGEIDLSTLPALWPEMAEAGGRGRVRLEATGDPRNPEWSGEVRIRDGVASLRGWSERIRDLEVDGTLSGNRLALERIEAREGARGRIRGTGEVLFAGLLPDDVTLDLEVERVLIATVPFLRAIGSSNDLRLYLERPAPGSPRAPKIEGTVLVDKAIYTGSFEAETTEPDPALMPTTSPDWLGNLTIRAQDQVRISNASAELRVQGDVDLIRDVAGLRLRGTVEIPQGRVPIFNNDFTITEGTLDFSRRPLEPEVDIRAETEVPVYDPSGTFGRELERIEVHLTGTFAQPTVTFTSENGLDDTSILRLLAGFGETADGSTATSDIGDVGLRAGLNFLERALANRIRGIDTIDIQTEEAGLDEMQSTRIAVGKYLSNSLYLRFSQGLSVTERDLFLEYQMTRRTLFTSELKRRLRESGAENEFNLDLKFRVKY